MRFLLFTLYAPFGAYGEVAVGNRRMGWSRPGRAAMLGMVGAAAGIDGRDEAALADLEGGLWYAVRTDAPGVPVLDWHTVATAHGRAAERARTRREALANGVCDTVVTVREWRADAFFTIALWGQPHWRGDLETLAEGLTTPTFPLYAGRRAGVLGLPARPEIVNADTVVEALAAREPNEIEAEVLACIAGGDDTGMVAFDADAAGAPEAARIEVRRDGVASHARRQHRERKEGIWGGEAR